ncbi:MAG: 50S ribosomal protein L22 [Candidatus Zambryskibacteria bacterium CG10_big_fil_rev_8_21_14_0_10_42_12]|uniref:Large ribosomal subunit protein uL22 n=1 Tax=Candidatus Zambryskibacteria bacterium CG10_big_fil_rev_8_21_14_0_10_42_12 TaxID=1975115 RepID=A0A2H0QX54_9BACT|nr:MAG: 50S ribosomal protein L22 [Candidatus Zambryskibacteria bacterium CG10_big_fil_rev_8_21_14_0_10_42_12]
METATAFLKQYRQSPRKVRLVADLVRGKKVEIAVAHLSHLPKRATGAIKKLLDSAVSNAKNKGLKEENLFVKEIRVDEGVTLSRWQAGSRGRGMPIKKRTSHVRVVLAEKQTELKKAKSEKLTAKS